MAKMRRKALFLALLVGITLAQNSAWGNQVDAEQSLKKAQENLGSPHPQPKQIIRHPLDPLTPGEITQASTILRAYAPGISWLFIWITLQEPKKADLLPYFLNDTDYPPLDEFPREALIIAVHPTTGNTYEGIVDLRRGAVERWTPQPVGVDSTFAADEMSILGDLVLDDPRVQERLRKYGAFYGNTSNVVTDVWKYGYNDKPEYVGRRLAQVFFYGKNFENDNFYAHPMGFAVVVDTLSGEILEIEEIPINSDFDSSNREGDEVPEGEGNYDPLISGIHYREDVRRIDILQPEGPSYTIDGNLLCWQKFKMRIGRSGREGLILHHVSYNDSGLLRPLLYRASLSELFVPYGDPRPPYHRKMALDVGEYGMGFSASSLSAPDACRGSVHFMDIVNNDISGSPWIIPAAFCIYEEDHGILWRKMDPVTRRIVTARSQRLVLTFVATVANYDYQMKWIFQQDASIRVEMVLTGIVSQNLIAPGASAGGHGTIVAENVNAQYHQHFFAVRLDTCFDGSNNSVSVLDIIPDASPSGSPSHPYGNAFRVNETVLRRAGEGKSRADPDKGRTWRIIGDKVNPVSGTPAGWKLIPDSVARLMMKEDSLLHPKCGFVDYDVWVTGYREGELYAGGFYLNESGLPEWVRRDEEEGLGLEWKDLVLWHVFGLTHVTRVEDGPVMPTESIGFWLKPANFFTQSPALDVPPITGFSKRQKILVD